jgi:branched-chain amino acid transport system ATP-binding protein
MPLLTLENISKNFGSLKVTQNITLSVHKGEALGVLGPNGAGKTTLFNLISGDVLPDSGAVHFKGQDITRTLPHRRCRAGIGRSYQIALPFEGMTVFENLMVGAMFGGNHIRTSEANDRCASILERTGLIGRANQLAGGLTLLDRKRLELARALATEPELAHELVELVQSILAQGISIIWIEHVVHALLAVATRLFVINFGEKLAEGLPREVMDSPEVKRVYMGIDV